MKIKISHLIIYIILFVNMCFIFGVGSLIYQYINTFKNESIRFIKDIDVFENIHKDNILKLSDSKSIFTNNKLRAVVDSINNIQTKGEYDCNSIFIYDIIDDSINIQYANKYKHIYKQDSTLLKNVSVKYNDIKYYTNKLSR